MVKNAFRQNSQQKFSSKSSRKTTRRKTRHQNAVRLGFELGLRLIQGAVRWAMQMLLVRLQVPTSIFLLAGLLCAYGLYIVWLGFRPIVVIFGFMIVIGAMLSWLLSPSHVPPISEDELEDELESDLLNPAIFYPRFRTLFQLPEQLRQSDQIYRSAQKDWARTRTTVESIHTMSMAIAQQESLFIPDLLDILHTVLSLVSQYTRAFSAVHQIKTLSYQRAAQNQISASSDRIIKTHSQLQTLHDQLLSENITTHSSEVTADVTSGVSKLQALIDTNKIDLADS